MTKSCKDCPSYRDPVAAGTVYKKSPGVPVCLRFGELLGKPTMTVGQQETFAELRAASCNEHGLPCPDKVNDHPVALVAVPDASIRPRPAEHPRPASCLSCANYIPTEVVARELGHQFGGLCAAKGRLISPHRVRKEADGCLLALDGPPRDTTMGVIEMPIFTSVIDASENANPIGAFLAGAGKFIEPGLYETDKPVLPEEDQVGIRAWRKVTNPHGDTFEPVFLPVFRSDVFDRMEQDKIPATDSDEHPEWYVDHAGLVYSIAAEWMGLDETPAVFGAAGTGKTELFRHMAWLMQVPFDRISVTRTSEVDDLLGKWVFEDGETRWIDGRVSLRWQRIGVLLLDEPNVGPDEVWQAIRPLTDNSKQLVQDSGRGQKLPRHSFCFFGMAMNPAWDAKYVGANEISDADGNRLASLFVDLPPEAIERGILQKRCEGDGYAPSRKTLDKVMKIARDIRQLIENGDLPISWGIRPQIAVIRKTRFYDLTTAYKRAIVDRLEPSTGKQILDIVSTYADEDNRRRSAAAGEDAAVPSYHIYK